MSFPVQVEDGIEFCTLDAENVPAGCCTGVWYGGMDHRYTGDGKGTIRLFPCASKFNGRGEKLNAESLPKLGYEDPRECWSKVVALLFELEERES